VERTEKLPKTREGGTSVLFEFEFFDVLYVFFRMFKSVIVWGPVSPGVAGVPGDMGRTFILPGWREIKVLDPLKVGVNLLDSLNIMFLFV
jgi:hypothetical protein